MSQYSTPTIITKEEHNQHHLLLLPQPAFAAHLTADPNNSELVSTPDAALPPVPLGPSTDHNLPNPPTATILTTSAAISATTPDEQLFVSSQDPSHCAPNEASYYVPNAGYMPLDLANAASVHTGAAAIAAAHLGFISGMHDDHHPHHPHPSHLFDASGRPSALMMFKRHLHDDNPLLSGTTTPISTTSSVRRRTMSTSSHTSSVGTSLLVSLGEVMEGEVKRYKCPRKNCTKIYKNSNGLKYHLEYGNCEIEVGNSGEDAIETMDSHHHHYAALHGDQHETSLLVDHHHVPITAFKQMSPSAMPTSMSGSTSPTAGPMRVVQKPYGCRVHGCTKRYKNVNGLKYHVTVCHPYVCYETMKREVLAELDTQ